MIASMKAESPTNAEGQMKAENMTNVESMTSAGRRSYPDFSLTQELGNAITHGIGALLAIPGLIILVMQAVTRGNVWHVVAYAIFGVSAIMLYTASTIYHATRRPSVKRVLEILDHVAIFVLIAGSYTAFALTLLRSSVGWWVFGVVWAIAAFGIVMEALFLNRWPVVTLLTYLAMGWLVVLVWKQFAAAAPEATTILLVAGGLSYTVGTVFYALGRRWGWFHVAWHLFVLGGTVCHFFAALAALPTH